MSDYKVMIKASMKTVKSRFSDYEDMEFEKRGDWTLVEDYSGEVATDEGEDPDAPLWNGPMWLTT